VIISRQLGEPEGLVVRMIFTDRLAAGGGVVAGPGGSSRAPFHFANLGSHVGDDPAAVLANRNALALALGIEPGCMSFMHPDHGCGTAWVGQQTSINVPNPAQVLPPSGTAPGVELRDIDAMITAQVGIGLVALAADCAPVVLACARPAMVGVVHVGWRGLVVDVLGAAVAAMREAGASPERISAWVGPSICQDCYPVPELRAQQVAAVVPQAVGTTRDGQPSVDVGAGVVARLASLGVPAERLGTCTFESAELYSHRRDGRTGRHGAAIAMLAASEVTK
jgi:hypothetical protein